MTQTTDKFEKICYECPFREKCHQTGDIPLDECGLISAFKGNKSPLVIYLATQFKVEELYKQKQTESLSRDYGWEETIKDWHEKGYDDDFRVTWGGSKGYNFIHLYQKMMELRSLR